MIWNTYAEMGKGLTDLPLFLLALIFGLLLYRKQAEREWQEVFFLVAMVALMGAVVHCIMLQEPYISLFWTILYLLMFELIRLFTHRLISILSGQSYPELPLIRILEGILYLATVICRFTRPGTDIYLFVLFAAAMLIRLAVCRWQCFNPPKQVGGLLAILLAALLFQALKHRIPGGVMLAHGMLTAALCVIYAMALGKKK